LRQSDADTGDALRLDAIAVSEIAIGGVGKQWREHGGSQYGETGKLGVHVQGPFMVLMVTLIVSKLALATN
jgi:hypothetical protein